MPTLTLKGLPDPLYHRLKARAAAHRRSLNAEIIMCLERAVGSAPIEPAALLSEIDAFRESLASKPLTDRELAVARRRGRA